MREHEYTIQDIRTARVLANGINGNGTYTWAMPDGVHWLRAERMVVH